MWPTMLPAVSLALQQVLLHGALSRAEMARRMGLSRASLTRITRDLVAEGYLVEGPIEPRQGLGRPSELLQLNSGSRHFLGVKLTGDVLYAVVTDLGANIVASVDLPIPSRSVEDVVAQVKVVADLFQSSQLTLTAVGIAIAGHIRREPDGDVVEDSSYLGWDQVPLVALVSAATGLPTVISNDVQALTAAEHWFGAGVGLSSLVVVTVGVGIGIGVVLNGALVEGAHGRPGKLSHLVVDPSGPECGLGHRGCVSSLVLNESIVRAIGIPQLTYPQALALADLGDAAAVAAFAAAGTALGQMIAVVANLVDPVKVILTGDGLGLYRVAGAQVRDALSRSLADDAVPVDLDVQEFAFSEWARGAAVCAIQRLLA